MYLVPALISMFEQPQPADQRRTNLDWPIAWWVVFIVGTVLVGWRHQVGGDWGNYLNNFNSEQYYGIFSIFLRDDPGYHAIQYFVKQLDFGIYSVNFVAAAIFNFGLILFCRSLPRPWLALSVSIPYIVIILGMGYTRQGLALGCIMAGLTALKEGRNRAFLASGLLAATFHKSAVLILPLGAISSSQRRWTTILLVSAITLISYYIFLSESVTDIRLNYFYDQYQSQGTLVRLIMNIIPALIVLIFREQFRPIVPELNLWIWMSIFAFLFLFILSISPSSTAVDRIALYILPLQVFAFSYLPDFKIGVLRPSYIIFGIVSYYSLVLFVWLFYAVNSFSWLPYRNYIFE